MQIPAWLWLATIGGFIVAFAVDLVVVDRKPHQVTLGEAGRWVAGYLLLAVAFGLAVLALTGPSFAGQFFAGYLTEYSLSVDNLFVFVIIMATFRVPVENQHKVLLIGILLALVLRGIFIAAGAAVIARFQPVFFLFGAFLLYTAWQLLRHRNDAGEYRDNAAIRWAKRVLPVTDDYDGAKVFTRVSGRRMVTPMLVVMVAIGTTDLLFAVDSIPAIFGLTKEPYLVFTANAFALLGLRQLYFLLGGLLDRLVYLSHGLAVILAFIGVKLILEALHAVHVSWAPKIPILVSLGVIVGVLAVTTVASLRKVSRDPSAVRRVPGKAR